MTIWTHEITGGEMMDIDSDPSFDDDWAAYEWQPYFCVMVHMRLYPHVAWPVYII